MDQNKPDNAASNQQQNVHLHMHHVCGCSSNVFPTYYPVSYRAPVPSLVSFPSHPVPRPYLQHYQYTQFNMGGQYSMPISHVTSSGAVFGGGPSSTDVFVNAAGSGSTAMGNSKERKDKAESQDANSDIDRENDVVNFEFAQITPPASELLLTDNSEITTPENFVKFLEKSCLTAEQIAYRNRNRPCFRNIQNLCIRTRSEILKPCTTISNIHSQGIPWATKDFIYAFVRLTNCWHILKGYWENRDGSSLGKIEKELTPEFRACYVRWEKETIELAAQLTRVFYNLDTNLVSPQTNAKAAANETTSVKKTGTNESISTSTLTNIPASNPTKSVRGIIHLPSTPPVTETVDQANQTYSGDFCNAKDDDYESEDEVGIGYKQVYMKPGSYNVPKKENSDGASASPRGIEFLETAQNVKKALTSERYWCGKKIKTSVKNKEDIISEPELDMNMSPQMNVHEWILKSNFSDFGEPLPVPSPETQAFMVDSLFDSFAPLEGDSQKSGITVLQRNKLLKPKDNILNMSFSEINSMTYRESGNLYEDTDEGITEQGWQILEKLITFLNGLNLLEGLDAAEKAFFTPIIDLPTISSKLKEHEYVFINEVVRDLRYLLNYYNRFVEDFPDTVESKKKEVMVFITEMFSLTLREFLADNFPDYDFSDIKGDVLQSVGPLKLKLSKLLGDEDRYL